MLHRLSATAIAAPIAIMLSHSHATSDITPLSQVRSEVALRASAATTTCDPPFFFFLREHHPPREEGEAFIWPRPACSSPGHAAQDARWTRSAVHQGVQDLLGARLCQRRQGLHVGSAAQLCWRR